MHQLLPAASTPVADSTCDIVESLGAAVRNQFWCVLLSGGDYLRSDAFCQGTTLSSGYSVEVRSRPIIPNGVHGIMP
jgi:hypothetical protein